MLLTETEILGRLAGIVEEEAGVCADQVQLDRTFTEDLDIGSLSMMTIVVNAEEAFGVRIPDDQIGTLKTVRDAIEFIVAARV
ncbi:MAG TPA: acyl carrier protein [Dermatophilaceae bacterium]|nr:acyl carrier protein [Dermatophilaceae bacterium]